MLEKVSVHAHLYAKTEKAKSEELRVTEIVCIFYSLMVHLATCEKGILLE